jgi:hypothetical protein
MIASRFQAALFMNRRLRWAFAFVCTVVTSLLAVASASQPRSLDEVDVQRITIFNDDGKPAVVFAGRGFLPSGLVDGAFGGEPRSEAGLLVYNELGEENGGYSFGGTRDEDGQPRAAMQLAFDRFGGDQQLVLGHYERRGKTSTGLQVFDSGLFKDYAPLVEQAKTMREGREREALEANIVAAGGAAISRVFAGRGRGRASPVLLSDEKGRPRIALTVGADGQSSLEFLCENGRVFERYGPRDRISK